MKGLSLFISYFILNLLVLLLFNRLFGEDVVLASRYFGRLFVYLWTPFVLTILLAFVQQIFGSFRFGKYPMLLASIFSNTIILWIMSRIPLISAFGITSYSWAISLGLVLATLQWWTWLNFEESEE